MNTRKLRAKMVLEGVSMREMSASMGISVSALYRKLNGKSEFTRPEISKAIQALKIDNPADVFFDE